MTGVNIEDHPQIFDEAPEVDEYTQMVNQINKYRSIAVVDSAKTLSQTDVSL